MDDAAVAVHNPVDVVCTVAGSAPAGPSCLRKRHTQGVHKEKTCGVSRIRRVASPNVGEYGGSVDGGPSTQPATLARMASGDWRYGQPDRPWPAEPAAGDEPPDLWPDEQRPAWSETPAWYPGTAPDPRAGSRRKGGPNWQPPESGWAENPSSGWATPRHAAADADRHGSDGHAATEPRYGDLLGTGQPSGDERYSTSGIAPPAAGADIDRYRGDPRWLGPDDSRQHSAGLIARASAEVSRPSVVDPRFEPSSGRHAAVVGVEDRAVHPRIPHGNAAPRRLLSMTATWYGIPALFCLVWLLVVESDRRGSAAAELLRSLPWALTAIVLSLGVAAILRWASINWRPWTLTLAAAIIGSAVATILHSFA